MKIYVDHLSQLGVEYWVGSCQIFSEFSSYSSRYVVCEECRRVMVSLNHKPTASEYGASEYVASFETRIVTGSSVFVDPLTAEANATVRK
jgi:hypothetical protein